MGLFNWLKRDTSVKLTLEDDIKVLEAEISKLKTHLTRLDAEVLDVATAQDIIRNKVLRKIQTKKTEEEEQPEGWGGIPVA